LLAEGVCQKSKSPWGKKRSFRESQTDLRGRGVIYGGLGLKRKKPVPTAKGIGENGSGE